MTTISGCSLILWQAAVLIPVFGAQHQQKKNVLSKEINSKLSMPPSTLMVSK
jgi:hypothetical protein